MFNKLTAALLDDASEYFCRNMCNDVTVKVKTALDSLSDEAKKKLIEGAIAWNNGDDEDSPFTIELFSRYDWMLAHALAHTLIMGEKDKK